MAAPEKPKKIINAEFYRTDAGGEPVREFLRKVLTLDERKAVGKDVRTVEYGWPIGMPVCKDLKNGLLEVRTELPGRICRILFSIHGKRMVLLHGFVKKTQKTPQRELDTALERKRHLENRK
jgi:phage-related protein